MTGPHPIVPSNATAAPRGAAGVEEIAAPPAAAADLHIVSAAAEGSFNAC